MRSRPKNATIASVLLAVSGIVTVAVGALAFDVSRFISFIDMLLVTSGGPDISNTMIQVAGPLLVSLGIALLVLATALFWGRQNWTLQWGAPIAAFAGASKLIIVAYVVYLIGMVSIIFADWRIFLFVAVGIIDLVMAYVIQTTPEFRSWLSGGQGLGETDPKDEEIAELNRRIRELDRRLSDQSQGGTMTPGTIIETVRAPGGYLIRLSDGSISTLSTTERTTHAIGRSSRADISLKEMSSSRQHASIQYRGGHYYITDVQSDAGTYLNDQHISEERLLYPGDHIRFGNEEFQFEQINA